MIAVGVLAVVLITVLTGYFVAQEFGFMAVDRARLRAGAREGDRAAGRALEVTGRTSFMLSGAQLGITVTGLVVGYLAEPMIGAGVGELLGVAGVPVGVGVGVGTGLALGFATVVQMVFGELFPKNLAIARPEAVARGLAGTTIWYLRLFGWVIRVFDGASNLLLRVVGVEPVHDVAQVATPRDLEAITDESRDSGELPAELWLVLDRVMEFTDRTARSAMIPRPQVATVEAGVTVRELMGRMSREHSRYPVVGADVDDVIGVVCLRDVLALPVDQLDRPVLSMSRPAVLMPESLPLPDVLELLRAEGEELGCVLDEFGGLAGVITLEDIAEELVGEITDEHDPPGSVEPAALEDGWRMSGSTHVDEASRRLAHDLPHGDYTTVGGLIMARLGRLPKPGESVILTLLDAETGRQRQLALTVRTVRQHVAGTVDMRWQQAQR